MTVFTETPPPHSRESGNPVSNSSLYSVTVDMLHDELWRLFTVVIVDSQAIDDALGRRRAIDSLRVCIERYRVNRALCAVCKQLQFQVPFGNSFYIDNREIIIKQGFGKALPPGSAGFDLPGKIEADLGGRQLTVR